MSAMDAMWNAAQRGDAFITDARMGRAQRRAAPLLAQGDYSGAAGVFGGAGFANEAMQLQQQQARNEQAAALEQRRMQEAEQARMEAEAKAMADQQAAEQERRREGMLSILSGLRRVPAANRMQAFQQMAGTLQQMGVPTEAIAQMTPDQMADAVIDAQIVALGGTVADPRLMQYQDTVVPFDPMTGRPAEPQFLPMSPRAQAEAELKAQETGARVDATQALGIQRRASAGAANARAGATTAASRRADRQATGGGGARAPSGGASSSRATLDAIAAELRRRGKL